MKKADLLQRMKAGDPTVTLDHRQIFEQRDIKGDWKFELIARTPDMYAEGDLLFGFSGGGPGYGDPLDRLPELVAEDLKKNIISEWTAESIYRVAFTPQGKKIDRARTEELRQSERKARLVRGKPYAEFVSGVEQKVSAYWRSWSGTDHGQTPSPCARFSGPEENAGPIQPARHH